jgi:hypothetical protein
MVAKDSRSSGETDIESLEHEDPLRLAAFSPPIAGRGW